MFSSVKSNTQALKNHHYKILCDITVSTRLLIKQNLFYAVMFVNLFFLRK